MNAEHCTDLNLSSHDPKYPISGIFHPCIRTAFILNHSFCSQFWALCWSWSWWSGIYLFIFFFSSSTHYWKNIFINNSALYIELMTPKLWAIIIRRSSDSCVGADIFLIYLFILFLPRLRVLLCVSSTMPSEVTPLLKNNNNKALQAKQHPIHSLL